MPPVAIKILADGVALFHAAVLAVYIAGAVSVLRGGFFGTQLRFWKRGYLAVVLAVAVLIVGGAAECPLTQLENAVRAAGDPAACYNGSFVEHYIPGFPAMVDQVLSVALLTIGCIGVFCAAITSLRSKPIDTEPRFEKPLKNDVAISNAEGVA